MTKQVFNTISFGERYLIASLIYIGIGLSVLSFVPQIPSVLADEDITCSWTDAEGTVHENECEDPNTYCCNGNCIPNNKNCCDGRELPDNQKCCKDKDGKNGKGIPNDQDCCAGNTPEGFDPSTHGSCIRWAVDAADTIISVEVYNKNADVCCDSKVYRNKNACCGSTLQTKIGYSTATEGCCYTFSSLPKIYNSTTHDCCKSDTHSEVYELTTHDCCGIIQGMSHWYPHVVEKEKCDCCSPGTSSNEPVKACD